MPSDTRVPLALDALEEPIKAFRSTLANTSEQIRLLISTRVEHNGASVQGARAEFGEFAAGRIDAERMSRLLTQVEPRGIEHEHEYRFAEHEYEHKLWRIANKDDNRLTAQSSCPSYEFIGCL